MIHRQLDTDSSIPPSNFVCGGMSCTPKLAIQRSEVQAEPFKITSCTPSVDEDEVYLLSWQSIKNCRRSSLHKLHSYYIQAGQSHWPFLLKIYKNTKNALTRIRLNIELDLDNWLKSIFCKFGEDWMRITQVIARTTFLAIQCS